MVLHDRFGDRQTQARTADLGGEHALEDSALLVRIDAGAPILDLKFETATRLARADQEQSILFDRSHGLDRVEHQIDHHLLEQDPVSPHPGVIGPELDACGHRGALTLQRDQGHHLAQRLVGVESIVPERFLGHQGAHPAHHIRGAANVLDHAPRGQQAPLVVGRLDREPAQGRFPADRGGRQGLVDLMGQRTGEGPQGRGPRHPPQFEAELLHRRFGVLARGDVAHHVDHAEELALRVEDRRRPALQPHRAPVGAVRPRLQGRHRTAAQQILPAAHHRFLVLAIDELGDGAAEEVLRLVAKLPHRG